MEHVVRVQTGLHRIEARRAPTPRAVQALYGAGLAFWMLPVGLWLYYRANAMTNESIGWRALGLVLAVLLAVLAHVLCWAGAFFYSRLVTSDQIAQEAERATNH